MYNYSPRSYNASHGRQGHLLTTDLEYLPSQPWDIVILDT